VGKKRFLQLKPYLTLQGATTLKAERVREQEAGPG
jgi:competence protein ComEA